jgi:hypothetical protein
MGRGPPAPDGWAAGLTPAKQHEWLTDCYRMRVDDDAVYGGEELSRSVLCCAVFRAVLCCGVSCAVRTRAQLRCCLHAASNMNPCFRGRHARPLRP